MPKLKIDIPALLLGLIYSCFRFVREFTQSAQILPDSSDYLINAAQPINLDFFLHPKPGGVALIYRLIGQDPQQIVHFQTLISIVAWVFLAWTVAQWLKPGIGRTVVMGLMLIFSLRGDITAQTAVILTESLSVSLMIFLLSLMFRFFQQPKPFFGVLLMVALIWWGLSKETNALLMGLVALGLLAAGIFLKNKRYLLFMGLIGFFFFVLAMGFSNIGARFRFPFLNLTGQRILTDPAKLAYFEEKGMPVSPALLNMKGKWGNSDGTAFLSSKDLRDYQRWVDGDAKAVYYGYLLSHPNELIVQPMLHAPEMLAEPEPALWGTNPWQDSMLFYSAITLIGLAALLAVLFTRRGSALSLIIFLCFVFSLPHLIAVWNGDAMEISRHALGLRVHWRLGHFWAFYNSSWS